MARQDPVSARFFQRASDGAWLARVDTESPLSVAEAELHCAGEYGFPVRAVEVSLPAPNFDTLVAQRRAGAVRPPVQPPAPLTAEQREWAAATTEQKLAMIGKRLGLV